MKKRDLNRYALGLLLICLSTLASGGEWISDTHGCKLWNAFPRPGQSVTWSGACRDGYADGHGVAEWFKDGQFTGRAEGDSVAGKRTGKGVVVWADGGRYEGDFVDGKRTGKGVFVGPNGNRYEGDVVEGPMPTGKGVFVWADGNRYEGDFVDGKRTGKGVFVWPNGGRYEGDFVDGKRNGKGVYVWADGNRYEGDFVDDKRTGKGVHVWADGGRYEGDFVDDKFTGKGVLVYAINDDNRFIARYEGDFVDGQPHGEGIETAKHGFTKRGTFSKGEFVDGYRHTRSGRVYGEVTDGRTNYDVPDDRASSEPDIIGTLLGVVQGVVSARGGNAAPYQAQASATGATAQTSGGLCSSGWPPAGEFSQNQSFCEKCGQGIFRRSSPESWDCRKNDTVLKGCDRSNGRWQCLSQ